MTAPFLTDREYPYMASWAFNVGVADTQ